MTNFFNPIDFFNPFLSDSIKSKFGLHDILHCAPQLILLFASNYLQCDAMRKSSSYHLLRAFISFHLNNLFVPYTYHLISKFLVFVADILIEQKTFLYLDISFPIVLTENNKSKFPPLEQ